MKRWLRLVAIVGGLAALAAAAQWGLPPLLALLKVYNDLIQGVTAVFQWMLWIATAAGTFLGIRYLRHPAPTSDEIGVANKGYADGQANHAPTNVNIGSGNIQIEKTVLGSGHDSSVRGDVVGRDKIVYGSGEERPPPSETAEGPTDDSKPTKVDWEARDSALLRSYLDNCAKYDSSFKELSADDTKIRQYLIAGGLARAASDGRTYLTHAGVLLCCRKERLPRDTFHVHVKLKTVTGKEDYHEDLFGPVLHLYEELHRRLVPLVGRLLGSADSRDESGGEGVFSDYPESVLIEALVNFLIHRDYYSDDIGFITVHPDRIEFSNPGQSTISPDTLMTALAPLRPHYRRNPRLIEALTMARLNEREGSGILRMRETLEKNGSYLPDGSVGLSIENDESNDRFILTIHKRPPPSVRTAPGQTPEERLRSLEASTSRAVQFFSATDIQEQQPPFLVGYGAQLNAAAAFIGFSVRAGRLASILAFGFPGTGKSIFPSVLVHDLNRRGTSLGLLRVESAQLMSASRRESLGILSEFTHAVAGAPEPLLVVFDELDGIALSRVHEPSMALVVSWLANFLDSVERGAVIAIANYPDSLDPVIRSRLTASLYFQLPDEEMLASLLERFKVPQAHKVAREVREDLAMKRRVATMRGLVAAAQMLTSVGLPRGDDPRAIAHLLSELMDTSSDEQLRQYEQEHESMIAFSNAFLRAWARREDD